VRPREPKIRLECKMGRGETRRPGDEGGKKKRTGAPGSCSIEDLGTISIHKGREKKPSMRRAATKKGVVLKRSLVTKKKTKPCLYRTGMLARPQNWETVVSSKPQQGCLGGVKKEGMNLWSPGRRQKPRQKDSLPIKEGAKPGRKGGVQNAAP